MGSCGAGGILAGLAGAAEDCGHFGGLGFGKFGAGALAVLLPGQDGLFDLEGIFRGDGDELAGDFDAVVMDGWGDAAEGVRGDPHDFGEVEVGSAELVEPPNELVGVGAAEAEVLPAEVFPGEAEGFVGALLTDGFQALGLGGGALVGDEAEGLPSAEPVSEVQALAVAGCGQRKGVLGHADPPENRLDPSGFSKWFC